MMTGGREGGREGGVRKGYDGGTRADNMHLFINNNKTIKN